MHLRPAALVLGGVLAATGGACKRRVDYDTSSPEATLTSFGKAIEKKNIPGHLAELVSDEAEQDRWRLRCQERPCRKARFQVVGRGEASAYRATLLVDYEVTDEQEVQIAWGRRMPVHFSREGGEWYIIRFGDDVVVPPRPPPGDAATADAGPGE